MTTSKAWQQRAATSWPLPEIGNHPIPGERYTSTDFFNQEWQNMWCKTWLLLGRCDEIPNPGDYQLEEVGPESFIIIRQQDDSINVFYNVCQHRGARLLFNTTGHTDAITCPYHGWRYSNSGELNSVRDPEDFPQGNPCDNVQLQQVKSDTFAGFVWINMDDNSCDLPDYLGPIYTEWQAYQVDHWPRKMALTARMPCNWKVIQDNFHESYHLSDVHPQIVGTIEENYKYTQFDLSAEGHNRMIMRGDTPSHSLIGKDEELLQAPLRGLMQGLGLNPDDFVGREFEVREAIQAKKRLLGPEQGFNHYDRLTDEQLTDHFHYNVFPNFSVSITSDYFLFLRSRPHPTDPGKCIFDNWMYVSPTAAGQENIWTPAKMVTKDETVEHETFDYGEKSLGLIADQDMNITTGQQLGFASRGFKGVYLSGQESRIRRYHEVIDQYLNGERPDHSGNIPHTQL